MDENLVGYLLNALDAEERQQVEASLQAQPELRGRLGLLERAVVPLAADAEAPAPPPGLVLSTLARIAEHQCHKLPPAPPPSRNQVETSGRRWLRRPDVLVAAMLLVILSGIGTSGLVHLWRDHVHRRDCENNLRLIWGGLQQYCDAHEGNFPRVEERGPRSVAGIFVPILCDSQMLSPDVSLNCPAQNRQPFQCRSVDELEDLYRNQPDVFHQEARKLAGNYAYTLGYRDGAGYHGLRCDTAGKDSLPIMADRLESLRQSNSPNHGGRGQNVLFLGGSVRFCTQRTVGINGDDIYTNWDQQVLAGKAREDTVLGPGDASPTPRNAEVRSQNAE
jgi:hypothetical protein